MKWLKNCTKTHTKASNPLCIMILINQRILRTKGFIHLVRTQKQTFFTP